MGPTDFDFEKYRADLDEYDMTEEQKLELLKTLWSIMSSFVELGFTTDICAPVLPDEPIPDDDKMG